MPNTLQGVKVGGTTYQYDYEYLANKPAGLPSYQSASAGSVLALTGCGDAPLEWAEVIPTSSSAKFFLVTDSFGNPTWVSPSAAKTLLGSS